MARATYRVHFVTHEDGSYTGRLLSASGGLSKTFSGHGKSQDEVSSQLALALEEAKESTEQFLWSSKLQLRKVKVSVHPQSVIKSRQVIAKEQITLDVSYVWTEADVGGYLVLVPRFEWWFVLEDIEMAAAVLRQAISSAMLGKHARSLYEFRAPREEWIVEWQPTLSRKPGEPASTGESSSTPTLHGVAEDLSKREGKRRRRPVVGDIDVERYIPLVERERAKSLLLVGPAGCGKTTWVRMLARRLSARGADAPRVWSTSADRIIAGMVYLGQWEKRCLDIIEELSGEGDLLFVDKLPPLCATQTGRSSIADMFLPALAAGEVALIAECTPEEFERLKAEKATFLGHFHVVRLRPAASAAMPQLLRAYQARIAPKITFTGEAMRRLVQHLEFFSRDSSFPGKGFRFLDWLGQTSDMEEERELQAEDVSDAFARSTGLPLELISEAHVAGPDVVAKRLRAGVVGQDLACTTAAHVLTRFKAGIGDPERPIGSLFFVGPTGVGKTELAKQLARYMFGAADKMVRLDMSEYMLPGSAQRLLAVGQGVRSLVERVRHSPLSLILLDEIEKAHAEVFDVLLAMLGEGRMTDTDGRLVDFRMTLVVMTSNLGVRSSSSPGFGGEAQTDRDLLGAVRQHFRPEFFNRIDHVVPFSNLSPEAILEVVDLELEKARRRAGFVDRGLELVVDAAARAVLARLGWHPTRGARPLKRVIEERLIGPVSVRLAADRNLRDTTLHVTADGDDLKLSGV